MTSQLRSSGSIVFKRPDPVAIAKYAADGLSLFFGRRVKQLTEAVQQAEKLLRQPFPVYFLFKWLFSKCLRLFCAVLCVLCLSVLNDVDKSLFNIIMHIRIVGYNLPPHPVILYCQVRVSIYSYCSLRNKKPGLAAHALCNASLLSRSPFHLYLYSTSTRFSSCVRVCSSLHNCTCE